MQKRVFASLSIAVLLLAAFTLSVSAEEKSDGQSTWEFYVAPFVWALFAIGNVTVKGIKIGGIAFGSDFAWDAFKKARSSSRLGGNSTRMSQRPASDWEMD